MGWDWEQLAVFEEKGWEKGIGGGVGLGVGGEVEWKIDIMGMGDEFG